MPVSLRIMPHVKLANRNRRQFGGILALIMNITIISNMKKILHDIISNSLRILAYLKNVKKLNLTT